MSPVWPLTPRRRKLVLLGVTGTVLVIAFLSGPSGLVSILVRRYRVKRLQTEMAGIREEIAARSAQRDWLANPDSAKALARKLLSPDPDTTGPDATQ